MAEFNDVTIRVFADTRRAEAQLSKLAGQLERLGRATRAVGTAQNRAAGSMEKVTREADRQTRKVNGLVGAFGRFITQNRLLSTAVAGGAVVAFSRTIDQVDLLSERMEVLTGDSGQFSKVVDLANSVGQSFNTVGTVSSRLALSIDELGASTNEVNDVTRAIFQLARISGSTSRELEAGSLQLAQGLASQRLAGDELRSVLENLPALAQELAAELGVGVQELREMGAAGELTGSRVFEALLARVEGINAAFEEMDKTIGQSANVVANEFKLLVSSVDSALGASDFFKEVLEITAGASRGLRFRFDPESFTNIERLQVLLEQTRNASTGLERRYRQAGATTVGSEQADVLERELTRLSSEEERRDVLQRKLNADRRAREAQAIQDAEDQAKADEEAAKRREERTQAEIRWNRVIDDQFRLNQRREEQEERARQRDTDQLIREEIRGNEQMERLREEDIQNQERARERAARDRERQQEESQRASINSLTGYAALAATALGQDAAATKAIRISQAIMATYAAAVNAFEIGNRISPALGAAYAGGAIAFGLAQVAQIRAQKVEGRAWGGAVTGGRLYEVNERGPEMYTMGGRQYLMPPGDGRVTPLAGGGSNVSVNVYNQAPGVQVQARQQPNGDVSVIVAQAVNAARKDFANQMASGYGEYANALQSGYGIQRRI